MRASSECIRQKRIHQFTHICNTIWGHTDKKDHFHVLDVCSFFSSTSSSFFTERLISVFVGCYFCKCFHFSSCSSFFVVSKKNKNYWLRSVRSKTHTNTQQTHTTWVENHFHLKNTTRKHFCEGNKMMKTVVFLFWKCYHKNVSNIPNSFFIIFILFSWAFSSVSLSNFTVFQTKIVLHILLLFQSLNHLKWCERFDLSLSLACFFFSLSFIFHFTQRERKNMKIFISS